MSVWLYIKYPGNWVIYAEDWGFFLYGLLNTKHDNHVTIKLFYYTCNKVYLLHVALGTCIAYSVSS